MMKWLIYLLLLANIGFFAWHYQQQLQPAASPVSLKPLPRHVQRLLLLDEVDQSNLAPVVAVRQPADPETTASVPDPDAAIPVVETNAAEALTEEAVEAAMADAVSEPAPGPVELDTQPLSEEEEAASVTQDTASEEELPPVTSDVTATADTLPQDETPIDVAEAETDVTDEMDTAQEPLTEADDSDSAPTGEDALAVPEPEPVVSTAVDIAAEPVAAAVEVTLAEVPAEATVDVEQPQPESVPALETMAAIPDVCLTIGPFKKDDDNSALITGLKEAGASSVDERSEIESLPRSYWVYLPRFPDVASARAMLAELKTAGIKDYARVVHGDMSNAISMGLFSRESSSTKRVEELQKKGYAPEVMTRYTEIHKLWLDIRISGDAVFDGEKVKTAFPDMPAFKPVECAP